MAFTIPWKHPEGYISPQAYVYITHLTFLFASQEVLVQVGIWENQHAFEFHTGLLAQHEWRYTWASINLDTEIPQQFIDIMERVVRVQLGAEEGVRDGQDP